MLCAYVERTILHQGATYLSGESPIGVISCCWSAAGFVLVTVTLVNFRVVGWRLGASRRLSCCAETNPMALKERIKATGLSIISLKFSSSGMGAKIASPQARYRSWRRAHIGKVGYTKSGQNRRQNLIFYTFSAAASSSLPISAAPKRA